MSFQPNQLVTYKGKKFKVAKQLEDGRYKIVCAVGCPRKAVVFENEITAI